MAFIPLWPKCSWLTLSWADSGKEDFFEGAKETEVILTMLRDMNIMQYIDG